MSRQRGVLPRSMTWRDLWSDTTTAAGRLVRAAKQLPREVLVSAAALIGLIGAVQGIEAFTEITEFVLEGGEYAWVDGAVLNLVAGARTPPLVDAFVVITHIGTGALLAAVALAGGAVLAVARRSLQPLLLLAVSLAGMALTVFSVKLLVARPRPADELAAYAEDGYGFPSGHAANTTTVYLMLAVLTVVVARTLWVRALVAATAVLVSGAVGLSRVVLGVHSPTDVLAGWVLAISWVVLVLAIWALVRHFGVALAYLRDLGNRLLATAHSRDGSRPG
jgi:undecaprenyl-diphosphatase